MADDMRESGAVEEGASEGGPRIREQDDAAREAAAEAAAASAHAAMAAIKRDEGHARKGDRGFADALIRLLQRGGDADYLGCVVQLLDRNVSSSLLLGILGLVDHAAEGDARASLSAPDAERADASSAVRAELAPQIAALQQRAPLAAWCELLAMLVGRLDADDRTRLTAANRDADALLQECLERTLILSLQPTPAERGDVARAAAHLTAFLLSRPARAPEHGSA